jgi:hypothetical protein
MKIPRVLLVAIGTWIAAAGCGGGGSGGGGGPAYAFAAYELGAATGAPSPFAPLQKKRGPKKAGTAEAGAAEAGAAAFAGSVASAASAPPLALTPAGLPGIDRSQLERLPYGYPPGGALVGDFNGDGTNDIALFTANTGSFPGSGEPEDRIFFRRPDHTYADGFSGLGLYGGFVLGVRGGRLLSATATAAPVATVWLYGGIASFSGGYSVTPATTSALADLAFADLDHDGLDDVIFAPFGGPPVVLRNTGGGAFQEDPTLFAFTPTPSALEHLALARTASGLWSVIGWDPVQVFGFAGSAGPVTATAAGSGGAPASGPVLVGHFLPGSTAQQIVGPDSCYEIDPAGALVPRPGAELPALGGGFVETSTQPASAQPWGTSAIGATVVAVASLDPDRDVLLVGRYDLGPALTTLTATTLPASATSSISVFTLTPGGWVEIRPPALSGFAGVITGVTTGDVDGDGLTDIVVTTITEPPIPGISVRGTGRVLVFLRR